MKKIFFSIFVAGILSSCAVGVYQPWARNNFGAQTTVVLEKANFRIVRNVEAIVEVNNSYLKRHDVEKSAYGQLVSNANLTGSQVLINVVIEEVVKRSKMTGRTKQYVAARATVIEFLDETGNPVK